MGTNNQEEAEPLMRGKEPCPGSSGMPKRDRVEQYWPVQMPCYQKVLAGSHPKSPNSD